MSRSERPILKFLCTCLLSAALFVGQLGAQEHDSSQFTLQAQTHLGISNLPNTGFPKLKLQTGYSLTLGHSWQGRQEAWAQRLNGPKTGITLGLSNLGNRDSVGLAYSLLPSIEFPLGQSQRWSIGLAYGGSHVDRRFDAISNPNNRAISNRFNWTYRSFIYYKLFRAQRSSWRLGLGYIHHSNGHSKLPNQGLNSFVAGLSWELEPRRMAAMPEIGAQKPLEKRSGPLLGFRTGIGGNVLSLEENRLKEIYSLALSYGCRYHEVLRLSAALYARQYAHYQDILESDHPLIMAEYQSLRGNPWRSSLALGLAIEAEYQMGHVAAQMDIGFNFFKPAYPIDWQLNEGSFDTRLQEYIYGELDWYYAIKHRLSSRLALNYYLISQERKPSFNLYVSGALNANLGQADFSELSIGLVKAL